MPDRATACAACDLIGVPTEGMTGFCVLCANVFCLGHLDYDKGHGRTWRNWLGSSWEGAGVGGD